MKTIPILLCLFIKASCFAQTPATDSLPYDSTIVISVLGNENSLTQTQLDTGFTLHASDPAIKIVQFVLAFVVPNDNEGIGWYDLPFNGNKAFIDKKYPEMWYDPKIGGAHIFIDRIVVERNGRQYAANSLIIMVHMKPRTLKQLRNYSKGFT